ncbi:MAG: hypothetical protein IPI73_01975 [Betaproteobacteria bacterium]|nr:hypothetical protein [Betaproteobacteria bacterium]
MAFTQHGAALRHALAGFALLALAGTASALTITVNSLADDTFPDGLGDLRYQQRVMAAATHCTLRMAISAANRDAAEGGALGCGAGLGSDTIEFDAALGLAGTPGTIKLADRGMSGLPADYSGITFAFPALIVSRELTITGPGASQLTIDGSVPGTSGRRLLHVSDAEALVDRAFSISGVRLLQGRTLDNSAGCMFSTETTVIAGVTFESCESVGGPASAGFGGALGIGNGNSAPNYRPAVTVSNSLFVSNRATRGASTTNRSTAGAVYIGSSTRKVGAVSLTGVRVLGNSAEQTGGISIFDASSVTVTDSQFISNAATGSANAVSTLSGGRYGGLQVGTTSGDVTITSSGFVGNTANQERGGFSITTVGGTTTINDVSVLGNVAVNARVGGFEVLTDNFDASGNCLGTSLHPVNISNTEVKLNLAATNTGGFRVICSGNVTVDNSTIQLNEVFGSPVPGSGGNSAGQISTNPSVTMTNVRIQGNKTFSGAGVNNGGFGVFTVQDTPSFTGTALLVRDNYAQQNESGLSLRAGAAGNAFVLTNSAFVDNRADGSISGLFLSATGNYTVRNTTFSGNSSNVGGAVFVNMNATAGSNAIVFENVTSARGSGGNLALEVGSFGAGAPSGTVTIKNSILGSGTSGIGFATVNLQTLGGVTYAVSNSLIENNSFGVPAGICGLNGNRCSVDARLEGVGANGGFPTLTHALKPGSPALDAGNNTGVAAFDQRGTGFPRIVGATVDMGAFESPALPPLCSLDADGNGTADALTDGLIMIRAMFGLTGTAVTNNALGGGASRDSWSLIRGFLNGSCGTNFAP